VKEELKFIKTTPQNVTFIFNLFYGSEKDFTLHMLPPCLHLHLHCLSLD